MKSIPVEKSALKAYIVSTVTELFTKLQISNYFFLGVPDAVAV